MKVALIHYWLTGMAGGEKVLEAFCDIWPEAEIFTHVLDPDAISPKLRRHRIHTSFIQRLPGATRHYQKYLPLMPLALEHLDLSGFDLVVSSESGPAKGVIVPPDVPHICYCHSPMRYIWDMYPQYRASRGRVMRTLMAPLTHYLRIWDRSTAQGVDRFVANSRFIARRIARTYHRESIVLPPPVAVDAGSATEAHDGSYLMLGRLTDYKRADLAVEAFRRTNRRLVVIGGGEQLESLRTSAPGNVRFLGPVDDETVDRHLSNCRALLFPGLEDFGIVPIEAMARGKPVLCYGRGGVLDTVIDGRTGLYFHEQTPEALLDALERLETGGVSGTAAEIRDHARRFSTDRFTTRFRELVDREVSRIRDGLSAAPEV